jgi:pimeloyl-ACP methyl ester carboxylesterase
MPVEVILPRVDMDMKEGKLARWHVKEGEAVSKGQTVFEIETDKAAMEIEAPAAGIIRDIAAEEGAIIPVGAPIAWIYAEGEAPAPRAAPVKTEAAPAQHVPIPESLPSLPAAQTESSGATPAARRLAKERGLEIGSVRGTGPRGRVQADDVLSARQAPAPAAKRSPVPGAGALLHMLTRGDLSRPPAVFIHGFGADQSIWKTSLASLDASIPIAQLDLPAHGKSPLGGAQSFADIVESVAQTLDASGIGPCHLVGHSFGGMIALALAAAKRVDARSLMMIAPAGLGPDIEREFLEGFTRATRVESLAPWLRLLFAKPALVTPAFAKAIMQSRDDETLREQQRKIADTMFPDGTQANDLRAALDGLAIPCKIVWGRQDRIIPPTHTANLPGHVALHLLAETGHVPHLEQPALVARLISELIKSAV